MRRLPALATICLAFALPVTALAETLSKPLRNAVPARAGGTIVLENLAGTLEVVAGQGAEAVPRGTAYSDAGSASDARRLLDAVTVDVKDGGGRPTIHVTYPVDEAPFRYRTPNHGSWSRSSSTVDYQGRRVRVTDGRSSDPLLYADLTLEVPPGVDVQVTNHVGRVTARRVGGDLDVKTASADLSADEVAGALKIRTGSGDIRVSGSAGLDVSTGSGDVEADRIQGAMRISTGSGDVRLGLSAGERVSVQTGSGDVSLDEVAGSLELHTGSGDIDGRALSQVERLDV
ncbi:MAG: DUF4097 family beta strand repeat protein, partial [Deltaproteobacteria bacterium]|nr:DUF4097 family beta strand repeat protein [Deltaproteobacteria bacterium]